MMALKDTLSELSELSKQLKDESASLSEIVSSVEAAINAANPGSELWPGFFFLAKKRPCAFVPHDYWDLGYGRSGDGWRLLARHYFEVVEGDDSPDRLLDATAKIPLSDCRPAILAAAVPLLENFVQEIIEEVRIRLAGLRVARARSMGVP